MLVMMGQAHSNAIHAIHRLLMQSRDSNSSLRLQDCSPHLCIHMYVYVYVGELTPRPRVIACSLSKRHDLDERRVS